ncbi:hypothetical protein vseg_003730 [Gypsophila vaccaria]
MPNHSHFHLLSPGSKTRDVEKIDTEISDDVMDAVHYDTEVVHYPDSVDNSETDMLYGYDTEVVPDSEDEAAYTNDSERRSSRRASFIESLAADLYKAESHPYPLYKKLDLSNMNIDNCGLAMDTFVCQGNELSPVINHSDMQTTDLALQGGKMAMVKDPLPTDSISCDLNSADDVKLMTSESKAEKNGKLSQSKTKDVHIVYTRKTNRLCKPDYIGANDVKGLTDDSKDYGGLSYVESQEPEDVSTALHFVEQYLSVSAMALASSPMASVKTKQNSPPALSAKGVQRLVRWTGARKSENKAGIFEWNDSLDGDGGCIPSKNRGQPQVAFGVKKYKHTYVRRSPSVNNPLPTAQVHKTEVREDSKGELDQQTAQECTLTKAELNAVPEDFEPVFDVGIGTQIAAEAIQALSSALSADCVEMNADQCPTKLPEKSGEEARKQMHAGFWSFPKKTRSSYRDTPDPKSSRIQCFDHLDDITQSSKQVARRNNGKVAAARYVVGSSAESDKVKVTKKTKGYRPKDVYIFKENLHDKLLVDDASLCKQRSKRKVKNIRSASATLKSSCLFNMNEGLVSEPMCKSFAPAMKSGRYYKRKVRATKGDMVDISVEKEDHFKDFSDSSLNTVETKSNDDDNNYSTIDNHAVDILVEKESGQMENYLYNMGADASSDAMKTPVSHVGDLWQSTNQFLRDYPRRKRTRRSTLDHFERYSDLKKSSDKATRSQFNAESYAASSASHCSIKRKRRSMTYISPCLLSSKRSGRNYLDKNDSVYDNDFAKKTNASSEQLTKSNVTVKVSALDVAGCKANMNSCDVASPSCQASTCDINNTNSIDGYRDLHDKKRPSPTTLTRELHRLGFVESMPDFTPKTSRQRKTMANIRVLLSQSLDKITRKHQTKILLRFGVPLASCPSDATHFVTDRLARTKNMMEFIAQGKPVVTPQWLESCDQAGFYIDDRDYIVRDTKKERELGFKLPVSLDRARRHPLLKGYTVFITPNAKPGKEIIASLVKAVHGEVVNVVTDSEPDRLLILSCDEDQTHCIPFIQSGTAAYSSELLLNGIIIQKLEFARHRLFIDQVKE